MAEIVRRWVIYIVSEDGLLKHPKDYMGDFLFNQYGYEDEWEAVQAIERKGNSSDFVILQTIFIRTW